MGRHKMPVEETCLPALRRAALRLFSAHGVAGASVRDISGEAGVSEAALYRHYKSKDELAYDLFVRGLAELLVRIQSAMAKEQNAAGKIAALIDTYCRAFDEEPSLHGYLIQAQHLMLPKTPDNFPNPRHTLRELVKDGQAAGEFAAGDAELMAASVLGMVERVAVYHIYGSLSGAMSKRAPDLKTLVLKALAK